ncbi:MAG: calcium-translocating P-type ATPase, PMCA-type [Nitrospirota bacterium]|nr:calcium-translocating P-type ATPase, PMCA-type [Nitrospirota bacterium]
MRHGRVARDYDDYPYGVAASAFVMAMTRISPPIPSHSRGSDVPVWHALSVPEVAQRLTVDLQTGLSAAETARRIAQYGPNEIRERPPRSLWRMFLDQFTDFMILVLIGAGIISGIVGEPPDAIAIVVIVLLNGVIGFVQEYRAERAVAALKLLAASTARVRRGGQVTEISALQLVPGDVVLLEAGNTMPADLRLIETVQLKVDESPLTGESVPVEKRTDSLHEADAPLGDRVNLAYKGTSVTYGRGCGLVVATGMQTELGRIASMLGSEEAVKTPLQKRLAQFGQRLALVALAICAIVFAVGVLRGESMVLMFLTAVSLAVAAIPEALPAVVTVSLALGARRLVKKHALIRRLAAVETLGSVTYICSDKTGTLTQNKMRVEQLFVSGQPESGPTGKEESWRRLLRAMALSNDAVRHDDGHMIGDPTEIALFQGAAERGYGKAELLVQAPRVAELPFDSDRKCMTTLHREGSEVVAFTKGAPEQVVALCDGQLTGDARTALDTAAILDRADRMAADGLRVLAVAYRTWPDLPAALTPDHVERGLTFLGLVGLMDPPREEAREAVALCKSAGITPVMITGDHPATARAIALRLGIIENHDAVLTGQELAKLTLEEYEARVEGIRIYARVSPEQKITIVKGLQDQGEFVAMTGDGVNDAPALQRADIGIAMGLTGTDVARESSHMILLDDNFSTIVTAVEEGRRIFDNIRKFIKYALSCNTAEVWTIFLAPFLGMPIPLMPIHILWINLVTDGLPGLALAVEPEEKGLMERPPRPPRESIFADGMWQDILWIGLLMGGVALVTQAWAYRTGHAHWQTMVFTVLTLSQMGNVLALRSERESFFTMGPLTNLPLLGAVMLTFALQMATIYIPALNPIFKTEPLDLDELLLCLALSSIVFIAVEIEKWCIRQGWLRWNTKNGASNGRLSSVR